MNFSERLRDLRRGKNLSQSELGKLVGLHYTQIGRYERGESRPSSDVLKRLAGVLNVSTDFLMDGSAEAAAKAHLQDRELLEHFRQVEELGEQDKHVVKIFLNAFLTKKKLKKLVQ